MRIALKVLLSVTVLTTLLLLLPWSEVRAAVVRLPAAVWIGVLAGFVAGHGIGVVKWRSMVNAGRAGLRASDAVGCYAAGLFANLCLPSIVGGDVLRAAMAGKSTGRPEAAVLGGIGDRLSDVLALALLMGIGGLVARNALPGWASTTLTAVLITGAAGAALLSPLLLRRPLARWPARVRRPLGRALVALRRMSRSPGVAARVFAMSLGIQTAFVLLNAWAGRAIGIDVPLAVWFLVWPLAKVAGLLPISLGGLGVRDATLGALLSTFGVTMASGVVASLIWQSVLIAGGLIAGGLWWAQRRRSAVAADGVRTRPANAHGGPPASYV
jgi:uncharacterized membrane protein YbhN (UPF0104 family)